MKSNVLALTPLLLAAQTGFAEVTPLRGATAAQVCSAVRNLYGNATRENPVQLNGSRDLLQLGSLRMETLVVYARYFDVRCSENDVRVRRLGGGRFRQATSEAALATAAEQTWGRELEERFVVKAGGEVELRFQNLLPDGSLSEENTPMVVTALSADGYTVAAEKVSSVCFEPPAYTDPVPCIGSATMTWQKLPNGGVSLHNSESPLVYVDASGAPRTDANGKTMSTVQPPSTLSTELPDLMR